MNDLHDVRLFLILLNPVAGLIYTHWSNRLQNLIQNKKGIKWVFKVFVA